MSRSKNIFIESFPEFSYTENYKTISSKLSENESESEDTTQKISTWLYDGKDYIPHKDVTIKDKVAPGYYKINYDNSTGSFYISPISIDLDDLFVLPFVEYEEIINDVTLFWNNEQRFKDYGFVFKRGILMYGPQGTGKTSLINLIAKDLIENRKGILFSISSEADLQMYVRFMPNFFRVLEPDTPVIVVIEDIDNLVVGKHANSILLNVLDGMEQMNKIVYIATTNYPEELEDRILNRPSRFDRRYYIGLPNDEVRRAYLKNKIKYNELTESELDTWVEDTKGLTISHLAELFKSVIVLQQDYDTIIDTLKSLKKPLHSSDFSKITSSIGFLK